MKVPCEKCNGFGEWTDPASRYGVPIRCPECFGKGWRDDGTYDARSDLPSPESRVPQYANDDGRSVPETKLSPPCTLAPPAVATLIKDKVVELTRAQILEKLYRAVRHLEREHDALEPLEHLDEVMIVRGCLHLLKDIPDNVSDQPGVSTDKISER